ncbi:MAG: hypothetical protein MJ221_05000 [Bacilli bacterium]|nr:hypothetical protein [Bacilli bacterium]
MKKSLLLFLILPFVLAGCGGQDNPSPEPEPEPTPVTLTTTTFVTSGESYKSNFTNGGQFTDGHSGNIEKLTTFLNGQSEVGDFIKSLDCVSCNSLDDVNKDGYRYFTIGSAKANGSITFNSDYDITYVKVECMNYNNTYTTGGGGSTCDRNAHLLIDEKDNPLELNDTETPSLQPFDKTYDDPVNNFTIASHNGRVFIKSITVSYYA